MVPRQSPVYRFHSSKSRESNTDTRSFLFALEVALYKASTIWEERGIHVPGKVIPANPVHVFYQIVLLQLSFSYLFYHTAELQIKEPYYNLFEATITSAGCNIIAPAAAGGGGRDPRIEQAQLYLCSYFCNQLTSQYFAGSRLWDAVDKCHPP